MNTILDSLQLRLLLVTMSVLTITIGALAFFSSHESAALLRRYAVSEAPSGLNQARDILTEFFAARGNWNGVQQVLEQTGRLSERNFILTDVKGEVIATSGGQISGRDLATARIDVAPNHIVTLNWQEEDSLKTADQKNGRTVTVTRSQNTEVTTMLDEVLFVDLTASGNSLIGTLYLLPVNSFNTERNQITFINSLNGSLFFVGIFAVCAAMGVTFALSRQILKPVAALTTAVRHLENGDLNQRVKVLSKDEIGQLSCAFNRMAETLMRTETLRRNLVNDVAHELRTPLTHIRCQLESIQDGLLETSRETIDLLYRETMQLNHIIDDLQELALAESNQLKLDFQSVSVKAEIDYIAKTMQPQTAIKGIILTADIPDNLSPIKADPQRLGQILRNLLNNALTQTPAGGKIEISARQLEFAVEITVSDTGAGIAPEHLDKIFERFYRVDQSRERKTGGAGLGLAIVKQLLSLHGGQLRVASIVNQGTVFILTFPVYHQPGSAV